MISKDKRGRFCSYLLLTALLGILVGGLHAQDEVTVQWMTIEEAEKAQETEPRKVVVDIYTDWCTSVSYTHLTLPTTPYV